MTLREDYGKLDSQELKLLLTQVQTDSRRAVVETLLTERGENPVIWTVKRRGWSWRADGWEITRVRRCHPGTLNDETVYQVWQSNGTWLSLEAAELAEAKQYVQRVEDDRRLKTDYPVAKD